jgi:hypothetical protein
MSLCTFAAHLYGIESECLDFLEEKFEDKGLEFDDVIELIRDGSYDELPDFPEKAKDVEVFPGPGVIWYFGYSAQAPYRQPLKSQKEMDESIHALTEYLFGKETADGMKPDEIYDTWVE